MKHYLIDEEQLKTLKRVASRLYSENRFKDGDEMRNAAQSLDTVIRVAEEFFEMPEPETWAVKLLRDVADAWTFSAKPIELRENLAPVVEEILKKFNPEVTAKKR